MDNFTNRIAKLSPAKRNLFELALTERGRGDLAEPGIPRAHTAGPAPLSFAQQRLWFLSQLEPDSSAYNQPKALRLSGALNVEALKKALDAIVCRHEVLRTTFTLVDGGTPVQSVGQNRCVDLPLIDLSSCPDDKRNEELQRAITEITERRFDLSRDLMIRAALLRLDPSEHVFLLVTHHIATDGWSSGILWRELALLYAAFSTGEPNPLPELPVQYADYAVWQRSYLQGEVLEKQLSYWKKQLCGVPVLELPVDRPRPAVQSYRGARLSFAISKTVSEKLKTLSRNHGVTLFMTLLAAFQTLLHRYTGQEDIAVGSAIANRTRAEIEGLIGFFVNTLVLRTDVSGDPTFRELVGRVRKVALEAYGHQDLPFEKLVEELNPDRKLSRTPLFQVMFVFQNAPRSDLELRGLDVQSVRTDSDTAKFDLTLSVVEGAGELKASLEYNTDLFDAGTIARMLEHFQRLLEGIVADPERRLSELAILTEAERRQIVVEWNDTGRDYPKDKCIHELFEAQVERTPDAVAVVFKGQQLTYRELNARANQLAHYLRTLGVGPDVPVGICVERSLEMVAGLLGILKAGGAYVPLDPDYPKERIAFMLEDAQVPILLTQRRLIQRLPEHAAKLIQLDAEREVIAANCQNPASGARGENIAYVIFTSGSTGKPKGVPVTHTNVERLFTATEAWYHFDEHDVWTLFHSYAFDFSVWEIWGALLYGGRLVVVPYLVSRSPERFYELLRTEQVTVLNQTPSAFRQLIQFEDVRGAASDLALRYVIFGGEALELHSLKPWFSRHGDQRPQLVNMYGITETTVHVTYRPITLANISITQGSVIGVRIPDLHVYILDQVRELIPVGVVGELYIGGRGVARGYLHRPELTAEKFIPNPFSDVPGARLYKTGDLARYLPDGNIEFLGRVDHQVKIRGFRIELGEIEAVLSQHPTVRETVVIIREDVMGEKRLVAYVVPSQEPAVESSELRTFLQQKLPGYMIPSAFVFLKSLPLTASGKVNRQALPAPDPMRPELEGAFVPPRTPTESIIAKIWRELLGVDRVGVHDDFFDLGGHSLLAVRLFARIEKELGKKPPLSSLFERATVEHLASLLAEPTPSSGSSSLVAIQPHGSKPPFFCVHEFFGDVLCYSNLARHLGEDQPFYALQARGLDGSEEPFTDIKAMAAYYVKEIRTVQPKGPYALGGLCIGGVVAFEMALQLCAKGEEVALVALLDSGINSKRGRRARWLSFLRNLPRDLPSWLIGSFQLDRSQWLSLINLKFRRLKARRTALSHSSGGASHQDHASKLIKEMGDLFGFSERHRSVARAQYQALRRYKPQVYPGRVTLFRARMQPFFSSHNPDKGWGPLAAGGLDIRVVPGNHLGMLQEPHVRVLAEKLRACLGRDVQRLPLEALAHRKLR